MGSPQPPSPRFFCRFAADVAAPDARPSEPPRVEELAKQAEALKPGAGEAIRKVLLEKKLVAMRAAQDMQKDDLAKRAELITPGAGEAIRRLLEEDLAKQGLSARIQVLDMLGDSVIVNPLPATQGLAVNPSMPAHALKALAVDLKGQPLTVAADAIHTVITPDGKRLILLKADGKELRLDAELLRKRLEQGGELKPVNPSPSSSLLAAPPTVLPPPPMSADIDELSRQLKKLDDELKELRRQINQNKPIDPKRP